MNRNQHHAKLQNLQITKDLVDLFSDPKDLLNISNATVVSIEIAQDLA